MRENPILDEIHKARKEILARYEGDVHAYIQDARRRALESGRPIATVEQAGTRTEVVPPVSPVECHRKLSRLGGSEPDLRPVRRRRPDS